jgi:GTP pyrophosphokinase
VIELTERFDKALVYAATIHRQQQRKAAPQSLAAETTGPVSYLGHLLGAAAIVIDARGTEDEAIAALLHDAVEDQGGLERLEDIRREFGEGVAAIVEGCSDSTTAKGTKKAHWPVRKTAYIEHLLNLHDRSTFLVSAADKCNNARATARDLAFAGDRRDVWAKFNPQAALHGTLWYYDSLIDVYQNGPLDPRRDLIISDLALAVAEIRHYVRLDDLVELEVEDIF